MSANEQASVEYFINLQGVSPPTMAATLTAVCPLWIHSLVEVHQNCILRFQLSVKHTFHVTMRTWLKYIIIITQLYKMHNCMQLQARECSPARLTPSSRAILANDCRLLN